VLALTGSYHGDTLGAAQAQAPSVFTGPTQAPWYSLRGVFVEPPTAALSADGWQLTLPRELAADLVAAGVSDEALSFASLEALFSASRDATPLGRAYRHAISSILSRAAAQPEHGAVGAAIIEPVLHGASGMVLVDPAFQRAVASMCASAKVPLIADEVFSGLWRLGAPAASQLLGVQPDIACYAKLLTGGTVPLAATLASEEVFDAFRGSAKTDALLHGHSYSAHPIGCAAACAALDMFAHAATNPNLLAGPQRLRELWEPALVSAVCAAPGVARVVCVGTVFAAELAPVVGAAGYHSNAARGVVKRLRKHGAAAAAVPAVFS
jgi:dethiobiotin synthetase/adenosylmethionine--8-amino-7-oxononanoate aminotransferase